MSQFSRGITFLDGTSGHTASEIHQLVDNATALPGLIIEQSLANPIDADLFLFVQSSTNTLKKIGKQGLVDSFPRDAAAGVYSLRRLGTGSLMACAGNDSRLRNPVRGIRVGQGPGVDREGTAIDIVFPSIDLHNPNTTVIDWTKGNVFFDHLTGDKTYTFSGAKDGQSIDLIVTLNGHTVTISAPIGATTLGTGTTIQHWKLTKSGAGTTGLLIRI